MLQNFRWEAAFQPSVRHVQNNTEKLKAVLKVNAQAGRSGIVNKTSLESTAQNDDFQEVKRRKRHISVDTSQIGKMPSKSVPISTAVKQTPKTLPNRNFFATPQNY
jgi:hypothetical protein